MIDRNQVLCMDALDFLFSVLAHSVDLIFTDPPYDRASAALYGKLAEGAAHCLKPGGFVLAMAGGLYTDRHLELMSAHLEYFWTFHVTLTGKATGKVHPMGSPNPIITRSKPIYAFVKGRGQPRTVVYDPFSGDGNDKRFHHWGQDMKSARYYIDCFSRPGEVVVDPFCGGGTTPVVAQALGRDYIGCDIDPEAVKTTRARLENPFYTPERNGQMTLPFAAAAPAEVDA